MFEWNLWMSWEKVWTEWTKTGVRSYRAIIWIFSNRSFGHFLTGSLTFTSTHGGATSQLFTSVRLLLLAGWSIFTPFEQQLWKKKLRQASNNCWNLSNKTFFSFSNSLIKFFVFCAFSLLLTSDYLEILKSKMAAQFWETRAWRAANVWMIEFSVTITRDKAFYKTQGPR